MSVARFKIGGNHNEVFIVTDNSLHSSGVLAPRSHLIADLVMGRLTPAPIWRLPLCLERKSLESIASKKRAEYRRRFQLLDQLTEQVAILTQRHAGD